MDATQARDVVKMNLPRVLENLRLLVSEGVNVIPRLPLIPGFTLSRENMQQALDVLIPLKSGRSICYRFISTANRNTACWGKHGR